MRDERVSMERGAVESMQGNLDRAEPAIVASYGLIGAIMLEAITPRRINDTSRAGIDLRCHSAHTIPTIADHPQVKTR